MTNNNLVFGIIGGSMSYQSWMQNNEHRLVESWQQRKTHTTTPHFFHNLGCPEQEIVLLTNLTQQLRDAYIRELDVFIKLEYQRLRAVHLDWYQAGEIEKNIDKKALRQFERYNELDNIKVLKNELKELKALQCILELKQSLLMLQQRIERLKPEHEPALDRIKIAISALFIKSQKFETPILASSVKAITLLIDKYNSDHSSDMLTWDNCKQACDQDLKTASEEGRKCSTIYKPEMKAYFRTERWQAYDKYQALLTTGIRLLELKLQRNAALQLEQQTQKMTPNEVIKRLNLLETKFQYNGRRFLGLQIDAIPAEKLYELSILKSAMLSLYHAAQLYVEEPEQALTKQDHDAITAMKAFAKQSTVLNLFTKHHIISQLRRTAGSRLATGMTGKINSVVKQQVRSH